MTNTFWIHAVQAAGACHFMTLVLAHLTPIPRDWDNSLARLPPVHRRFAIAQNIAIGAVIAFAGAVSLLLAPELVAGTAGGRALCVGTGLWWGGRLVVLSWLRLTPELTTPLLRLGFALLHIECALFGSAYLWLAVRRVD